MPTTKNDKNKVTQKNIEDSSTEIMLTEQAKAEVDAAVVEPQLSKTILDEATVVLGEDSGPDLDPTVVAGAAFAATSHEDDLTVVNRDPDELDSKPHAAMEDGSFEQSPKLGSLIKNRFALVDEIGKGGMGVVYCARDLRKEEADDLDSKIAIKLLSLIEINPQFS